MNNVFVRPALDAAGDPVVVRDPQSGEPLKAAGEWKPAVSFWLDRIRDVDVIEAVDPSVSTAPAKRRRRRAAK